MDLAQRVRLANGYAEDGYYPLAIINVTNRCNLECAHCFVYRDANPNVAVSPRLEIPDDELLEIVEALRDRHRISLMLWMGGEPLLRRSLLERGTSLFARNIVTTNGTLPLVDLGQETLYVISLDGPEQINDAVRGDGSYAKVMRTLSRIPDDFATPFQVQCTVTAKNQAHLALLVDQLRETKAEWMTFSFYVPGDGDYGELAWATLEERMVAVNEVARLKDAYPGFIRNRSRALELMSPENAPGVTENCLPQKLLLPLYLEGDHLTTPFCCYGEDVDCSRCGAWVVFEMAARAGTPDRRAGARARG